MSWLESIKKEKAAEEAFYVSVTEKSAAIEKSKMDFYFQHKNEIETLYERFENVITEVNRYLPNKKINFERLSQHSIRITEKKDGTQITILPENGKLTVYFADSDPVYYTNDYGHEDSFSNHIKSGSKIIEPVHLSDSEIENWLHWAADRQIKAPIKLLSADDKRNAATSRVVWFVIGLILAIFFGCMFSVWLMGAISSLKK
jgi:hypothetical protein